MMPSDATTFCEDILREEHAYNIAHGIWPSQNAVIDRMLARRGELAVAYSGLCERLATRPAAIKEFLRLLTETVVVWSPERSIQARDARARLGEVQRQIAVQAQALAVLLDKREVFHNSTGFYSDTQSHVLGLIETASAENGFFQSHVKDKLQALRGQFDMKYWPELGAIMRVIARDAAQAEVVATDPMTAASTSRIRASRADFFRALFEAIEQNRGDEWYEFPAEFSLSDSALAFFASVVLDLGPDDLVEATYVKNLRQRERAAG